LTSVAEHLGPTSPARAAAARIAPYDVALLATVTLLLGLGAVMVYSATINDSTLLTGDGAARLKVHLVHVSLGVASLIVGMFVPYRTWQRLTYPSLFVAILLLVAVIFIGTTAGNARRWIRLPGFSLQPAEIAKLAFVIFLSYSLAKKAERIRQFSVAFIPHLMVCGLLILLCLFQPDFGTSIILAILMFTMLFAAGTRLSYISLFVLVGGFLGFQAIASNDMRLGRVMAFIDPWAYRTGRGYQMVNSQIAIGSGGLSGQGVGYGGQTLTGYLPEGHTDFILSVIAEQLGFIGVALVIFLFGLIVVRGISIALNARDDFGRFLAFGITLLIGLQAVINMLVAVGMIPTKGLTLPFVSYGGSSMLVSALALGILLNISRDQQIAQFQMVVPESVATPADEPIVRAQRKPRKLGGRTKGKQTLDEVLK
jgi:cell division protein FtsW